MVKYIMDTLVFDPGTLEVPKAMDELIRSTKAYLSSASDIPHASRPMSMLSIR